MDCVNDLPYLLAGYGEMFFYKSLIIVYCVEFVDGRDVGKWKIWTTWWQAKLFMLHLVCLMELNKAKCVFDCNYIDNSNTNYTT